MNYHASPEPFEHDPLIGTRICGYRIERVHGHGGTSVVYAAVHERHQRVVAIKVLGEASATDADAVARFELEARMGSWLAHANMVGVSDFGRLPDGRPFLVMQMVPGEDMATVLALEGPLPPRRVAALLAGVASALDFMHERGFVHRDIKSENLMHVVRDDGSETALVFDFGIICAREEAGDDWSGTPEFMAPEALAGDPCPLSDIYSLATVAFEWVSGELPYVAEDRMQLESMKNCLPPRTLAQAGGREFPRALERVIARSLGRWPEQRHSSATAFVRELARAAAHVPEAGPSSPPRTSTFRPVGRR